MSDLISCDYIKYGYGDGIKGEIDFIETWTSNLYLEYIESKW